MWAADGTVANVLSWTGQGSFELNGTSFRTLPPVDLLEEHPMDLGEREFFVFKAVEEVESYVELVRALEPQRILELGVFGGGSTMLLAEIARPQRIVALDLTPLAEVEEKMARAVAASDLDPTTISLHGGVDQSDAATLERICASEFGGEPLDLVIDDASHQYLPTLASFNALFPRLRRGGLYVIEDWRWAHTQFDPLPIDGSDPDRVPMTRLLVEALTAFVSSPGIVAAMRVEADKAIIERGDVACDPLAFDVADHYDAAGRTLQGAGTARGRSLLDRLRR